MHSNKQICVKNKQPHKANSKCTAPMIEVFKTNVPDQNIAQQLLALFDEQLPQYRINFDLEDCDRILRVESERVNEGAIVALLQANGFLCEVLE